MVVSNLSTYKFGKAKPEAGVWPPRVRAQEWDGSTQDLLWLLQWDFPSEMPCSIQLWEEHGLVSGSPGFVLLFWVWPLHFIRPELIPLSSSDGINHFLTGAVLRTFMNALAQALFGAVWVPGAPGTSPCTAALAGGSQELPLPVPEPRPCTVAAVLLPCQTLWLCLFHSHPSLLVTLPLPNSFRLLEAPFLPPLVDSI